MTKSLIQLAICGTALALAAVAENVQATWGLDVLSSLIKDQHNAVIPIEKWQLEGFVEDQSTFRVPSVKRSANEASITARAPLAGSFFAGFILYDSAGDERISIRIDGVERGIAVADADDNRDRLFFLSEPHLFRGGEKIELRTLTRDGIYRTEGLILLKEKPAPREFEYHIRDPHARVEARREKAAASITWLTSWSVACTLEWGEQGGARLARVAEGLAVNNHRIVLNSVERGKTYRYRITATVRDGKPVASSWQSFTVEQPSPVIGTVKKARVPLHIRNPQDSSPAGVFPVTSGVPFPQGALGSDLHVRLLDPQGRQAPFQTEVLARWPDGSVKWVLLDFQAAPSVSGGYSLEYGTEVSRQRFPTPLEVVEAADGINVTTGPLRFTISKRRFGLFESLSLGKSQVVSPEEPAFFHLTAVDGTQYTSLGPPDEIVIEKAGPLRAVVRAVGRYRAASGGSLFAHTVRVHAYAGQPFVRIEHTWGNDSGAAEFTSIRELRLRLPLRSARSASQRTWSVGTSQPLSGSFSASRQVDLRQHTDDRYTVEPAAGAAGSGGKRADGWAEWQDGEHKVTLAVRNFWQTYPKDLTVAAGALELGICPPLRADEYQAAKGTVDEHRLYFYLQNGLYRFRQGMSQTQDIWVELGRVGESKPAAIRSQRAPLLAVAPADCYAASKAFGALAPSGTSGLLARYDSAFAGAFAEYLNDRETFREFGMLNFGDWWGERGIDWGNSEYDTQHAFFMQFVRTGDVRYFLAGEEMESHNRDVDTIHFHRDESRVGGVYHHSIGHTGDYYAQSPVPGQGMLRGILTVDHVFTRGHLDYYFLAGDRRSLETARRIADRYDLYDTRNYDFNNCRVAGWHLILTMALYEATRDRFYLNAAKIIVERVWERQTPDGGWDFFRICLHQDPPMHYGNFGFTVGVLLTGLKHYYEATGDDRAAREIVRGAYFLVNQLWVREAATFRYTSCPMAEAGSPMLTFLLLDGIAFAHNRTRDPGLRDVLVAATQKAVTSLAELNPATAHTNMDGIGKELGLYISNTAHFIGHVAALR